MHKTYRNGPLGALIDEYERAVNDLRIVIGGIDPDKYSLIVDSATKDRDCHSIQTIMNHVVRAGYGYANYFRQAFNISFPERKVTYAVADPSATCIELDRMMAYTVDTFRDNWNMPEEALAAIIFKSTWGPVYDAEQMLEHAIVHVLRHRRQIEKFIIQLNNP